jgi:hypothetical protein
MVNERCRSVELAICGETMAAIARIVMLAAITLPADSRDLSAGSWVIAAESDPYGMLTKLYASWNRAYEAKPHAILAPSPRPLGIEKSAMSNSRSGAEPNSRNGRNLPQRVEVLSTR